MFSLIFLIEVEPDPRIRIHQHCLLSILRSLATYQGPDFASEMDPIKILHKTMNQSLKPEPNIIVPQIPYQYQQNLENFITLFWKIFLCYFQHDFVYLDWDTVNRMQIPVMSPDRYLL